MGSLFRCCGVEEISLVSRVAVLRMTAPSWFSLRRSVLSLTSLVERGKGLINRGIERESTQGNEISLAKHEVMRALKPLKKQMYDSVWQKR